MSFLLAGCDNFDGPKLSVKTVDQHSTVFGADITRSHLVVTSHDDRPLKVTDIIINDKADVPDCHVTKDTIYTWGDGPVLPPVLNLGDTIDVVMDCGTYVRILVKTDKGDGTFEVN